MSVPPTSPFRPFSRWEGALVGVGAVAVYFLFVYFGDEGRGTLAAAAVGCIAGTVRICWPLRREWWFWVTIGAVAAIHVLAGVAFDWSAAARWDGLTFMPLMLLDFAVVLTTIYWLYRLIYGSPAKLVIDSEV
jgi:hypothetical protein